MYLLKYTNCSNIYLKFFSLSKHIFFLVAFTNLIRHTAPYKGLCSINWRCEYKLFFRSKAIKKHIQIDGNTSCDKKCIYLLCRNVLKLQMFVDEDLSGIAIQALACSSWMFIKNHLMMSMYAYLIQL